MSVFSVGSIGLDLVLNNKGLKKAINKEATSAASSMESAFSSSFKKIGMMAATAFSVHAISNFVGSCLELGSNLTEVQNVVDVAFPSMSAQVDNFAKTAMESFGLSETIAKQYMGTFGAMSQAFGFTEKEAYQMSETLTGLAGDVASFYNLDPSEAYTKLKSVFTGETETLKELGVVMTQSALDQYALANGYGRTTSAMTEQEKVSLRLAFVTDQLSMASGDFIRTQDSWANQTRILSLRFESLKASLGKGFITIFNPIVKGINWVLANLQPLADSFASMMEMLTGYSAGSSGGGSAMASATSELSEATSAADGLSSGLSDTGSAGTAAAKKIQKAFAGVDTINKLTFDTDTSSGSGSGSSGAGTGDMGSVADAVEFPKATQEASVFSGALQGIIDEVVRLANVFKDGFTIGFGDSLKNIERIKDYIGSIGESIKNIFTAPEVMSAATNWVDATVFALGQSIGAIASIATTIATLLVGSVATYLQQNTQFIRERIVNLFDISASTNLLLGNFRTVVADIASVFAGSEAIQIGANLIQAIANGALNSLMLINQITLNILQALTAPIIDNKEAIKGAITEFMRPLVDITGTIADSLTDWDSFTAIAGSLAGALIGLKTAKTVVPIIASLAGSIGNLVTAIKTGGLVATIKTLATTHLPALTGAIGALASPIGLAIGAVTAFAAAFGYLYSTSEEFRKKINKAFNDIAKNVSGVVSGLVGIIQTIWTKGVQPVVSSTITAFQNLWNNGLAMFIENVSMFAMNIINMVMSIWNKAVNPLIDLLLNNFLPVFTTVWDGVLAIAQPIIEKVMEFINMFMSVLNDLMSLLNDHVFPIFKEVFDGISQAVQAFYDFAKPFIDKFIEILGGLVDFALDFFLAPLTTTFSTVVDVVSSIIDPIGDVIDGVKDMLGGIISFITGVFTGNWSKAWDGVKKIFSGMWGSLKGLVQTAWNTIVSLFSNAGKIFSGVVNGISNVFKNIVNCMLDGINRVIRVPFDTINGLLNGIKSVNILGFKPFDGLWGYNPLPVPQIPKLAEGGYVGANQPQLAMIGDNRHQGEIVAPEGKMLDMINTALAMQKEQSSPNGLKQIIDLLKQLISLIANMNLSVDIDRKKLAVLLRQAEKELEMIGG